MQVHIVLTPDEDPLTAFAKVGALFNEITGQEYNRIKKIHDDFNNTLISKYALRTH